MKVVLFTLYFILMMVHGCIGVCHQGVNCILPNCSCPATSLSMRIGVIPQIVYFGFDDALNIQSARFYRHLFSPDRKNPNGCPISMSLYVQHAYTDYDLVNEFYLKGMEIGVHSVTHTNIKTAETLLYEAEQQRKNLATFGKVPMEEIIGWRSPNLKTAGDAQPGVLQKLGYKYDISLVYLRSQLGQERQWPFTLDNGYPFTCMIEPCPSARSAHPGFWEVPVNSLIDFKNRYPCPYVDGCYNRPNNEEEAFKYLWQNFLDYYESSRTPLGFSMHSAWFYTQYNLKAMDRFIKQLLDMKDVYILNVKQLLEFMEEPRPLDQVKNLASWNCKQNIPITTMVSTALSTTTLANTSTTPPPSSTTTTTATTLSSSSSSSSSSTTTTTTTTTTTAASSTETTTSTTPVSTNTTTATERTIITQVLFREGQISNISPNMCVQGVNCLYPDCTCRSTGIPGALTRNEIPQMVYLAFDGPVTFSVYDYLKRLFNSNNRNPNGCPMSATLFVSRNGNSMHYLEDLAKMGIEISLKGDNRLAYQRPQNIASVLSSEIINQKSNRLYQNVTGWRSPGLKPLGDIQFSVIKGQGLTYDSTMSMTVETSAGNLPWPYTLDFRWQDKCNIKVCPSDKHPGLWEVPVVPLMDYLSLYPCTFADGCMYNPPTADDTFNFLWNNFKQHYSGNRSPFGINLRNIWYSHTVYKPNLEGLELFVNTLQTLPDVYVVSIENVIDWMKDPTPVSDLKDFLPWQC